MLEEWEELLGVVKDINSSIIEDYFEADGVDRDKFWSNYECLLRRHESALLISWEGVESEKISPSLTALFKMGTFGSFPMWFVSAYPDVVKWVLTNKDRIVKQFTSDGRQMIDLCLNSTGRGLECRHG